MIYIYIKFSLYIYIERERNDRFLNSFSGKCSVLWPHTFITWIHIYFYLPRITLEGEMATHSSILAWETPWTEEPGGLQSRGSPRIGHN